MTKFMKKLLLASFALVSLAPAAKAEINLDLGGYFKGYAGYASQDTPRTSEFDFKRKSQVFFLGETTLDNGVTVGYNGQLMQDSSVDPGTAGDSAKVEQSYLYFSGNWGRMNLGRENGAAYLLQVSAPGADSNLDGQDIAFSFFNQGTANIRQDYGQTGAGTVPGVRNEDFQYADKITYITPKIVGFQLGVSFAPEVRAKGINDYFGMPSNKNAGGFQNLIEGGLRYDGEFGGLGFHAGGGYTNASLEAPLLGLGQDLKEFNLGGKLTYAGFGFGGAYNNRDGGLNTAGFGNVDTYVVGLDYTTGAYNFGASYLNSKGDSAVTGGKEDKYNRMTVGAGYTFGPGMKFNGSVGLHDLKVGTPTATAVDNKATVVSVGTDVQF